jgi:hypothetical protein
MKAQSANYPMVSTKTGTPAYAAFGQDKHPGGKSRKAGVRCAPYIPNMDSVCTALAPRFIRNIRAIMSNANQMRSSSMKKVLTIAALAIAIFLPNAPAFAQSQGSNQAADYALSWGAVRGGYGNAYARYGYGHYRHRRHWR